LITATSPALSLLTVSMTDSCLAVTYIDALMFPLSSKVS
jgi:hypothetical protein